MRTEMIQVIEKVVDAKLLAKIVYRDSAGRLTTREIEPHDLVTHFLEGTQYLIVWDKLRGNWRTLKLDSIYRFELINQTFKPKVGYNKPTWAI